jgi:hypothetical protein
MQKYPGSRIGTQRCPLLCSLSVIIIIFLLSCGATQAIRLCNSYLEWSDRVLAPPNLLLVLNVQVSMKAAHASITLIKVMSLAECPYCMVAAPRLQNRHPGLLVAVQLANESCTHDTKGFGDDSLTESRYCNDSVGSQSRHPVLPVAVQLVNESCTQNTNSHNYVK